MSFRVEEAKNNFYKIVVIKDFGNCKIFSSPLLQIFLKTLLSTKIFSLSQHLPRHNPFAHLIGTNLYKIIPADRDSLFPQL
jgi:hypothetical protein